VMGALHRSECNGAPSVFGYGQDDGLGARL
jgi:hypothetical protein